MRTPLLLLLAACGGTSAAPGPGAAVLRVSAEDGVHLSLPASPSEGAGFSGRVKLFHRSGSGPDVAVTGANVLLEGQQLPEPAPGQYDAAALSGLTAGATLHLLAFSGDESASVTFKCPAAPSITSPADQAQVPAGALSVSWSGRIAYNAGTLLPQLLVRPWDPQSGELGAGSAPQQLGAAQTQAQVTLPSGAGYALELVVPGDLATQASTNGVAICVLHQRVRVKE